MVELSTIIPSILATLAAGGWLTSRHFRRREEEKHAVELEHARAEADALRQRTELDYTKEVLEIYSAHIVQPLKDQIQATNQRLDRYEYAINQATFCRLYPDCPVLLQLQSAKSDDLHG